MPVKTLMVLRSPRLRPPMTGYGHCEKLGGEAIERARLWFQEKLWLNGCLLVAIVLLAACNTKVTDTVDPEVQNQLVQNKAACDRGECPCDTPLGDVAHGSKITTYGKSSVACNEGCGKYAEDAICNNGKFDKQITGRFFRCEVEDCPVCSLGRNLILSGETIEVYKAESVGCEESCENVKQRRTCAGGQLSGSDEYRYFSCEQKTCRCAFPDDSGFISLNGKVNLYSVEKAACGKRCTDYLQTRRCVAAGERFVVDGGAKYRHRVCGGAAN